MQHQPLRRSFFVCLLIGGLLGGAGPARADPSVMTAREYKLWTDYQNALKDPRVKRIPARKRVARIARNFGVKAKVLKRAVAKGDKHAAGLVAENQGLAQLAAKGSKAGSKLASIELVDQEGVVIAYVSWKESDQKALVVDAVTLAKAVGQSAPLVDTIAMWACMGSAKVWTGMVRRSATDRISSARIEDFAETRYLRLFEDVHNRFSGLPPVKPKTDPETGAVVKDPATGKPVMVPDTAC